MLDTVMVTGGAGYIGSHIVLALLNEGYEVVVIDDLSHGFAALLPDGVPLIQCDFGDEGKIEPIFSQYHIETVIHAGASISVPESIRYPSLYYDNNVIKSFRLLQLCTQNDVKTFIFSSSSAVYGQSDSPISESHTLEPISPYGLSKLIVEFMLRDITKEKGLSSVSLRYFNAAGADPNLRAGDLKKNSTGLINRALQCISGQLETMDIYGTDYSTPDGTAIRDYIHVTDIAEAHLYAIKYAKQHKNNCIFNLGLGKGHSVHEIITTVQQISGMTISTQHKDRRLGDPAYVVADMQHTQKQLGFSSKYNDLEQIISHALAWNHKITKSCTVS